MGTRNYSAGWVPSFWAYQCTSCPSFAGVRYGALVQLGSSGRCGLPAWPGDGRPGSALRLGNLLSWCPERSNWSRWCWSCESLPSKLAIEARETSCPRDRATWVPGWASADLPPWRWRSSSTLVSQFMSSPLRRSLSIRPRQTAFSCLSRSGDSLFRWRGVTARALLPSCWASKRRSVAPPVSCVRALAPCALVGQFLVADLLALASTAVGIWALRIFRRAPRLAKLLGAYRRYPAFVRLAYLWLVIGALLGVAADLLPTQTGLGGASRHAVTVGFLATLIFAIGPRILPSFLNGRELYSPALMAASLWTLNLGCALRVSSEAMAYSTGGVAWRILPISALLEMTAVVIFVVNLGITVKRPIPAWLGPDQINAALPLYWYVTTFPETKSVLIHAGLKTLAQVQEPPRSMSLAEAAQADGADVEPMLAGLRTFFSQRPPKRAGRTQS
jgi:hypothetical protein